MDDAAVLGVDDGEEVGCVHAGALVQAGEVEELLGRRLHRLLRGAVERSGLVVSVHDDSFQDVAALPSSPLPSSSSGAISAAARAAPSDSTGR